jgi:hypothetical protein
MEETVPCSCLNSSVAQNTCEGAMAGSPGTCAGPSHGQSHSAAASSLAPSPAGWRDGSRSLMGLRVPPTASQSDHPSARLPPARRRPGASPPRPGGDPRRPPGDRGAAATRGDSEVQGREASSPGNASRCRLPTRKSLLAIPGTSFLLWNGLVPMVAFSHCGVTAHDF